LKVATIERILLNRFSLSLFISAISWGYLIAQINTTTATDLIHQRQQSGAIFEVLSPFKKEKTYQGNEVFSLSKSGYKTLHQGKKDLSIDLPTSTLGILTLLVSKINHLEPGFAFYTSDGKFNQPDNLFFYRGVIKGKPNSSTVTLTVRGRYLRALVTIDGESYVLGHLNQKKDQYAFVNEKNYSNPTFTCDWNESYIEKDLAENWLNHSNRTTTALTAPVSIYFESDYALFAKLGNNVTTVENYLASMFNELSSVYGSIGVPLTFHSSFIWTTTDIYAGNATTSSMLNTLRNTRTGITADLVHLLSGRSLGGIAYLNALCGTSKYGVSGSQGGDPSALPKSSFTMIVVAHEIGHNLGSHHTHNCVWNGDNTRIDNCGGEAGYTEGSCNNPSDPLLPETGTIMSYCHLISGVGSDYQFHEQVANRIKNYVNSVNCLDCDDTQMSLYCSNAISITENGQYEAIGPSCGNGCYNCSGSTNANWFTFTPSQNGTVTIGSCDNGVDTRFFVYSGRCESLTALASSDDHCSLSPSSSYLYASLIENLAVVKNTTYYIEWDNKWSSLAFNFDFNFTPDNVLLVPECTTDARVFYQNNQNQTVFGNHRTVNTSATIQNGQSVTIVASEGITLSPGFTAEAGSSFTAYIEECAPSSEIHHVEQSLSDEEIIEINKEPHATLNLFPNPFHEELTLEILPETNGLVQIFVYNLQGQQVLPIIEEAGFKSVLITRNLPLSSLKAGMYFVTIKTAADHYNRKIIKVQ
jgi:hypothetical protein